jgi:hypothetical protein
LSQDTVNGDEIIYFDQLIERVEQAIRVPYFAFPHSEVGKCHDNADYFVKENPDHTSVRGWLLTPLHGASGFYRIVAHSVVRRPSGELIDVTPMNEQDRHAYVFLEHQGAQDLFWNMKSRFVEIYYPPLEISLGSPFALPGM